MAESTKTTADQLRILHEVATNALTSSTSSPDHPPTIANDKVKTAITALDAYFQTHYHQLPAYEQKIWLEVLEDRRPKASRGGLLSSTEATNATNITPSSLTTSAQPAEDQVDGVLDDGYLCYKNLPPSSVRRFNGDQCTLVSIENCADVVVIVESTKLKGVAVRGCKRSLVWFVEHVDGSAYLEDCDESIVLVSCQQFRLHDSSNVTVGLSVRTRPIVEQCSSVVISPFPQARQPESGAALKQFSDFDRPADVDPGSVRLSADPEALSALIKRRLSGLAESEPGIRALVESLTRRSNASK